MTAKHRNKEVKNQQKNEEGKKVAPSKNGRKQKNEKRKGHKR